MRKGLLTLVLALTAVLQTAWAYDFSATSPSGHTLYYEIISGTTNVGVVRPGTDSTYDNYVTGNVVIPATVTYGGTTYNVTELRSVNNYGTFRNCSGLTSVTIPNSVTSIGEYAFYNCSGLTSVTIPNSVTSIGDDAFRGCIGLTSVTIPNSVDSIGHGAFWGCSSLTSVTIGNSVISIGDNAFYYCTGLTTLNFNAINCGDFSSSHHPFYCPITTINIGDSVQRIPEYFAYNLDSLTSVTIGNSVTSIGSSAFWGCSGLTSITIPNSVTSIGSSAFSGCIGLTTLNFNAINCSDFSNYSDSPFYNCPITTINIGDSVQRIPAYFAYYLDSISTITIPNSVTSIGSSAFWGCSGLTSVTIPNSVTSIGQNAFSGCSGLTTLNFNAINCNYSNLYYSVLPFYNCPIATINIGDSVQRIPACFAYGLYSLTTITIPNSVTSIGSFAFCGCSSLTSVTIPNSVISIGDDAFAYCTGLTSVTIPNSVTSIGSSAFYDCRGLTSVTIGNSVTTIGRGAFYDCIGLTTLNFNAINCSDFSNYSDSPFYNCPITTINIGDSVQRIPAYFAYNLESLTSVTIGNSVTSIGSFAFSGCSSLTSVTIPNSVTSIGESAFSGCNNLRDVTSLAVTPPTLGTTVFSVAGILKVPCGSLSAYRYSAWLDYFTIMEEICDNMTITVTSANESMGTVSGSGEYAFGTVATITAIPNEGYRFVSWNDGNTDNPRTITVTEDATYIASFEEGVGIESRDMLSELAFYPNPTSGIITFNRNDIIKVEVLDAMGRTVEVYENAYTIDISKLAKGYYAMRITTAEGVAVRKVIRK